MTRAGYIDPVADDATVVLPRYPVYVPSKGRADHPLTIRCLEKDRVPFRLVVEPSQADAYAAVVADPDCLLVLPRDDMRLLGSRNWIMDHAIETGAERHWQIDDNIQHFRRTFRGQRPRCRAGAALRVCEDFSDRYERVALSGPAYSFFVTRDTRAPFAVNVHVYSCTLVNNAIPHRWRLLYNDDTDLCLQVLSDGWFTIQLNAFTQYKLPTMTVPGGNTADLYQDDGRLRMARALERKWPGVVRVDRRFQRPQHIVQWSKFKQPLVRRADVDFDALAPVDEYGLELKATRPIESPELRAWVERQGVDVGEAP